MPIVSQLSPRTMALRSRLIAATGNPVVPVFYVIFASLLSGMVMVKSPETAFTKLN